MDETVDPPGPTQPHLVKLACIDDDAQGQTLEVLWEHEPAARPAKTSWDELTSREFDPPRLFAAYLNTLRWNCVTSTNPNLFQSPFRAGIRLDSYQIEPLAKALSMPRVNLFIADDVGLGKTIEAGLIARELLIRKKVNYIVVACPPSMLSQWQDELSTRFGLQFEILDKEWIQTIRQQRGFSANPFAAHSRFLISHRLLIDESYAAPLRDFLRSRARCSFWTKRITPRPPPEPSIPKIPSSPRSCATSPRASNTACSSRPRPTTAIPPA